MVEANDDSNAKRRKKKPSRRSPTSGSNTSHGLVHLGVTLICGIFLVYLYGVFRSANSLPEIGGTHTLGVFHPFKREVAVLNSAAASDAEALKQKEGMAQRAGKRVGAALRGAAENAKSMLEGAPPAIHPVALPDNVTPPKPVNATIPECHWPVSVRNEVGHYDNILHPGDLKTVMSVPRFWSDPVHNNEPFTREKAMKIGSCIEPDEKGNHARGDKCPLEKRTIYVAIASYRDWQCRHTVESIFQRAKYPERVRVGVVDQIVAGEDVACNEPIKPCFNDTNQGICKYKNQLDVYQMDAILAVGPVFARHVGHRLYRGEYYAMQSDAHVTFTQDWDMDILSQMEASKNDMAVLSTYLTDIIGSIDPATGKSKRRTRPIMCNTDYEGGAQGQHLRHLSQPERPTKIAGSPQLQPYWAAGYSFSRGHFVVNVPYDQHQPMIFQGEEMSIGIRGFTIGYDFYSPERSVCFHHYAHGAQTPERTRVKHFWENAPKYRGTGIAAMQRLLGIVHMNPEIDPSKWSHAEMDRYGIGKVRTPEKFYETFGIDVVNKKTEHHLCNFVDTTAAMHKEFSKFLRADGMGIDYDQIHFQFEDPFPGKP